MDNKYKEAADPPEEYSPKKINKHNSHIKTSSDCFMDKHLLKFICHLQALPHLCRFLPPWQPQ